MKYDYKCDNCEEITEIEKLAKHSDRKETCKKCNSTLTRSYNPLSIRTADGFKK